MNAPLADQADIAEMKRLDKTIFFPKMEFYTALLNPVMQPI